MRLLVAIALCAALLSGCAGSEEFRIPTPSDADPRGLPVESYRLVAIDEMNSAVMAAAAAGEEWPRDPLMVAWRFLEGLDGRYASVERVDEQKEWPWHTTITVIRGAWLDDSVWGVWDQLLLSRQEDGSWLIDEARRAWRCYRGHQMELFGERWCL